MQLLIAIFLLIFSIQTNLKASLEEERLARRICAHLSLKDFQLACEEGQQALILYPHSLVLYEAYIQALAKLGHEKLMLQSWKEYKSHFPQQPMNRALIEEMAWGVLNKAAHSSCVSMREMALLAAYFSQDAKGVTILHQGMRDKNYAIRERAVKLGSHFRDEKLIEEIKRLFKQETVWAVRCRVLEAIGKMKITSLQADLEALIASNDSLAEEKALAIAALLELIDTIGAAEIERLAFSQRAGLRQLACQAIAHFQSQRDFHLLLQLVKDPSADVRLEALQAMGLLKSQELSSTVLEVARHNLKDSHPQVALSAAWLLTLYVPQEGQQAFLPFLWDNRLQVRLLAAAALNLTGHYGLPLALEQFHSHFDPYVKLNLALGLIGQRIAVPAATTYLRELLITKKEKWSQLEVGLFLAISDRKMKKSKESLTTSEEDNQSLRLEVLNLLAMLQDPEALSAIRSYLMQRSWGISGMAAALLLTEGDSAAIDTVQQLLTDPQPTIRLQAALILSLWGREESAIQVLEESYATSSRELKSRILEGLGRIGSTRSIPFLINRLEEPSQILRLIAAMSLIQCLNH